MATLKNRRGKWYARVLWYDNTGKKKEKQIPLRTESKVEARARLLIVDKHQTEILELRKNGDAYNFPWMNGGGHLKIEFRTFGDSVSEWLKVRKSNGYAITTIDRNYYSMRSIMNVMGKNVRISEITTKLIDSYVVIRQKKDDSPNGININLRTLRTFLNWSVRRDYLDKKPYFANVRIPNSLPSYISDADFEKIMELEWLDDHFKKAFQFYRDSGCRLCEPFIGSLIGSVLVIPAKFSKTRIEKEIELDFQQVPIFKEMQNRFKIWKSKVNKPVTKYFAERYSKEFKRCCTEIEIDRKFHDLRHTFAIRRYLITRDIYQVMKEMGHSKVTTTQIYTKFNRRRLNTDFPSLAQSYQKTAKIGKVDTHLVDTIQVYSS